MCKLNTLHNLTKEMLCFLLISTVALDKLIQLTSSCHFHHHEDVLIGVQNFIELDDVRVSQELENFHFSLHLTPITLTFEIICWFCIFSLFIIFTATVTPVG